MLTPARRAHLASISQLGGLALSATHDPAEYTEAARKTFDRSFQTGHQCSVCPPVAIPADLPQPERERRATALRKLHFTRIARKRWQA